MTIKEKLDKLCHLTGQRWWLTQDVGSDHLNLWRNGSTVNVPVWQVENLLVPQSEALIDALLDAVALALKIERGEMQPDYGRLGKED